MVQAFLHALFLAIKLFQHFGICGWKFSTGSIAIIYSFTDISLNLLVLCKPTFITINPFMHRETLFCRKMVKDFCCTFYIYCFHEASLWRSWGNNSRISLQRIYKTILYTAKSHSALSSNGSHSYCKQMVARDTNFFCKYEYTILCNLQGIKMLYPYNKLFLCFGIL